MESTCAGMNFDLNMFLCLINNVNPLEVAVEIRKKGFVPSTVFERWISYKDNKLLWREILIHIKTRLSCKQFCQILLDCGYQNIALQFSQWQRVRKLLDVHATPRSSFVDPNPEGIFLSLKTKAYNKTFSSGSLKDRLEEYAVVLEETSDPEKRMTIADELAYSLCAGIDTVIMTFQGDPISHEWFAKLKEVIKDTTNTELFTVAYQSRLAIANATIGHLTESEKHLSAALSESFSLDGCLVIINLFYFAVYIKGCEFEKTPTKDIQDDIVMFIDRGIKTLESRTNEEQKFWKKMFLQRKIFCYLGLSNKAYPISNYEINENDLEIAKKLLAELYHMFPDMDDRRKQLYLVAKARYAEISSELTLAMKYLDDALALDMCEKFGETRHIKKYKSLLEDYAFLLEDDMGLETEFVTPDNSSTVGEELIFDMLSKDLPGGKPLFMFFMLLDSKGMVPPKHGLPENELYFHTMHKWYLKYPDKNHFVELQKVLNEFGREDLAEKLRNFKRQRFSEFEIHNGNEHVTGMDFCVVSEHLSNDFRSLMRYMGLPQRHIERIEVDNTGVQKQIIECFRELNELQAFNRQDLCDGLEYAGHYRLVIKDLNEKWKRP